MDWRTGNPGAAHPSPCTCKLLTDGVRGEAQVFWPGQRAYCVIMCGEQWYICNLNHFSKNKFLQISHLQFSHVFSVIQRKYVYAI